MTLTAAIPWIPVLVAAALGLSLLLFQAITGSPSVSATSAEADDVVALLKDSGLAKHATIYDLGCGWGKLVTALARGFPDAQIVGIEWSPLPYWISRLRTRRFANVRLYRGNFLKFDLRDANAVTCYLMMKSMPRLGQFLDGMLAEGTPVVALTFWFRGRKASAVREGPGLRGAAALYRWPAYEEGTSGAPPAST
jgi:trans-aconitate methyltransferase